MYRSSFVLVIAFACACDDMDIGRVDLSACTEVQQEVQPVPDAPASPTLVTGTWELRAAGASVPAGSIVIGAASWSGSWVRDVTEGPADVPCPIGRESLPYRSVDASVSLGTESWSGMKVELLETGTAQWYTGLSMDDYPLGLLPELEAALQTDPTHANLGSNRQITGMDLYIGGPLEAEEYLTVGGHAVLEGSGGRAEVEWVGEVQRVAELAP